MHVDLREEGLSIGHHRTARLMRENGLKARQKTRFKRTTDSDHNGPIASNLLEQGFSCDGPDQKWGVDISYIWTARPAEGRQKNVAGFILQSFWIFIPVVSSAGQ